MVSSATFSDDARPCNGGKLGAECSCKAGRPASGRADGTNRLPSFPLRSVVIAAAIGCGSSSVDVVAPAAASHAAVPAAIGSTSVGVANRECAVSLYMSDPEPNSSVCEHAHLPTEGVMLTYPCAGGRAASDFGASYQGNVTPSGTVELEARVAFNTDDGCRWESRHRIGGDIQSHTLAYRYDERLLGGNACAKPCSMTWEVLVMRDAPDRKTDSPPSPSPLPP